MRTREQIHEDMAPLRRELDTIEDAERKADAKRLMGKCFKYLNSYGGEKWWMYAVVTGYGYWPKAFTFQVTCDDEIIVKTKETASLKGDDYIEIPRKEFLKAWRGVVAKINKAKP